MFTEALITEPWENPFPDLPTLPLLQMLLRLVLILQLEWSYSSVVSDSSFTLSITCFLSAKSDDFCLCFFCLWFRPNFQLYIILLLITLSWKSKALFQHVCTTSLRQEKICAGFCCLLMTMELTIAIKKHLHCIHFKIGQQNLCQ